MLYMKSLDLLWLKDGSLPIAFVLQSALPFAMTIKELLFFKISFHEAASVSIYAAALTKFKVHKLTKPE